MQYIPRNTQQKPNMAQLLIYTPGINIYKHITQLENNEGICENTGKLRCAMSVASEKMSAAGIDRIPGVCTAAVWARF